MNEKEYNILVLDLADRLFRFVCKSLGSSADADDIVQNCFEQLWLKRQQVTAAKAKSYLFTIAYRECIDLYRRKSRRLPETAPGWEAPKGIGLKKVLDEALQTIDEQSRLLVLLKDYEGYSYEEIAHITDLSDSQVRVYLFRERKKLKEYIVNIENVI